MNHLAVRSIGWLKLVPNLAVVLFFILRGRLVCKVSTFLVS